MKKYIESIDLLKGLCLILMVFINFFDEIAEVSILESRQGIYIDFLVTSLVPNVFMTLMGFLLILSGGYKAKKVFAKAITILFVGFAVNLIRVPLPQLIGNRLGITEYGDLLGNAIYHLTMIDIYSFAGYALLTIIPFTFFSLPYPIYFVFSGLAMMAASFGEEILDWLPLGLEFIFGYLFIGEEKNVYFPLFPWLAYIFLGIGLGCLYLQYGKNILYKTLAFMGLILSGIGYLILRSNYDFNEGFSMLHDFYQHDYTVGIYLLGMAMLLIFLAEVFLPKLPQWLKKRLAFTSRNIMKFYFFSWVYTGWFVTLRSFNNDFDVSECIQGAAVIYLLSYFSVLCLENLRMLGAAKDK
ncbi:MAG: heparan-alpha-glucosaminide N-acetyltransferase domain-containing protein [Acidaminococcaceae bacterium]